MNNAETEQESVLEPAGQDSVLNSPETDDDKIELLRYSIDYLGGSINGVENRASILFAILAGLFAVTTYSIKEVFWSLKNDTVTLATYVFLALEYLTIFTTILFLVQALRPTRWFLGFRTPLDKRDFDTYLMWPRRSLLRSYAEYDALVTSVSGNDLLENYKVTHYIGLQLTELKFRYYRIASLGMKMTVLITGFGFVVLTLIALLAGS